MDDAQVIDAQDETEEWVYLSPLTPVETIKEQIRSAIARNLPVVTICKPHSMTLSVAGGGPSLRQSYLYLTEPTAAVNGSLGWLLDHGVVPHFCGICDPGPQMADVITADPRVRYYVASCCHPAVFDKLRAAGCEVKLWHLTPDSTEDPAGVTEIYDRAYPDDWHAMGGGCSMGLRWINLGYYLGFRSFRLHGLDSSFSEGATHAYPDRSPTDPLVFAGRVTRPNFLAQVYDFFGTLQRLRMDAPEVEIEVFGDGLLQDEWKRWLLGGKSMDFTRYAEPAQYAWPPDDEYQMVRMAECRLLMAHLLPFLDKRGVAVQAGGNVGVLPNMLSYWFDEVHTFEPDRDNLDYLRQNIRVGIKVHPFAVGDQEGSIALQRDPTNTGATRIAGEGDIPMRTIDSLGLTACDLICLDIEGYELAALYGAASTIKRCKPVICFEEKGLSETYQVPRDAAVAWLGEQGYTMVGRSGHDLIFAPANPC